MDFMNGIRFIYTQFVIMVFQIYINVDFFFLKQCEYIQRNTIFSGNVHEARAYPPTRNLFTENTSS